MRIPDRYRKKLKKHIDIILTISYNEFVVKLTTIFRVDVDVTGGSQNGFTGRIV